jgi:hypothetical protein
MIGRRMKIPSRPYITLGTAASSSIRKVRKFEILGGAISARKIAEATPSGIAISRARKDVTQVP